ncbi:MAG TPA: hypothetical protein VGL04_12525 [Sporichthyaceae bacterium]
MRHPIKVASTAVAAAILTLGLAPSAGAVSTTATSAEQAIAPSSADAASWYWKCRYPRYRHNHPWRCRSHHSYYYGGGYNYGGNNWHHNNGGNNWHHNGGGNNWHHNGGGNNFPRNNGGQNNGGQPHQWQHPNGGGMNGGGMNPGGGNPGGPWHR